MNEIIVETSEITNERKYSKSTIFYHNNPEKYAKNLEHDKKHKRELYKTSIIYRETKKEKSLVNYYKNKEINRQKALDRYYKKKQEKILQNELKITCN